MPGHGLHSFPREWTHSEGRGSKGRGDLKKSCSFKDRLLDIKKLQRASYRGARERAGKEQSDG